MSLSAPYARPSSSSSMSATVDAMLIDALRASIGPYVPESARVRSVASVSSDDSLSDTSPSGVDAAEAQELPSIDAFVDHDSWSLQEAGSVLSDLSRQLPPLTPRDQVPSPMNNAPLEAWSDDDIMDIMPMASDAAPARAVDQQPSVDNAPVSAPVVQPPAPSHWAAQAREREAIEPAPTHHQAPPQTEAAAQLLESLARRVRGGELVLPGFSSDMGDAAALASTLAALLGVKH